MNSDKKDGAVCFFELPWDTKFFKMTCAKAILHKQLTEIEWIELKKNFEKYQFVVIENLNSNSLNAQLVNNETTALLVDINIQFLKKTEDTLYNTKHIIDIYQAMKYNEQILEIAHFPHSRFTYDTKLAKIGGTEVHRQWLINSFDKKNKFFAVSQSASEGTNGFLLHSYSNEACIVELIAVSNLHTKKGIATSLFKTVEREAYKKGYTEIKVGTQLRNTNAMNLYTKCGCKEVARHEIYHLWND